MNTSLRHYDPWKDLEGFRTELSRLFGHPVLRDEESTVSDWMPAVDVKEEDDRYVIEADVPGVDPKEIEIHMENGILTIKGERHSEKTEAEAGQRRVERVSGSFCRILPTPKISGPTVNMAYWRSRSRSRPGSSLAALRSMAD